MDSSENKLTQQEAAHYIADMTADMRSLAKGAGLEFLAYLLEMTYEEAFMNNGKNARKKRD